MDVSYSVRNIDFFFFLTFVPHPAVVGAYSWFCAQGSYVPQKIELGLVTCKESTLISYQSCLKML